MDYNIQRYPQLKGTLKYIVLAVLQCLLPSCMACHLRHGGSVCELRSMFSIASASIVNCTRARSLSCHTERQLWSVEGDRCPRWRCSAVLSQLPSSGTIISKTLSRAGQRGPPLSRVSKPSSHARYVWRFTTNLSASPPALTRECPGRFGSETILSLISYCNFDKFLS